MKVVDKPTTRSSHKTRDPPASAKKAHANPSQHKNNDARPMRLANIQFIIPTYVFGVQKARYEIDTGVSVSFCSQHVLDSLRSYPNLRHQNIQSYNRKLVVLLGDGSAEMAEESVDINLQFSKDELSYQCAVLPTLPNGIDLILGNDFLSTHPSSMSRVLLVQRSEEDASRDTRMLNYHAGTLSASQRSQSSRWTS